MNQTELHPPQKSQYYSDVFRGHVSTDGPNAVDAEISTKTGEIIPVNIQASVAPVGDRLVIQGVMRDMTEYREYERKIKQLHNRFSKAFHGNPCHHVYQPA